MSQGLDIDGILRSKFDQDDADRVMGEFGSALNTASKRDGGKVVKLAQQLFEYFCASTGKHSGTTAVVAGIALLYFIMPMDVIPDVTPLIGYADDVMVMSLALRKLYLIGKTAQSARGMFREAYRLDSTDGWGA